MKEQSFIPPSRMLMGPGPSDVSARVLEAMARPTIGHLDPEFISMMDEIKKLLQYTFITSNELTFAVSAPGMAGMECCFANLVEENDLDIALNDLEEKMDEKSFENFMRIKKESISKN